MFTGSSEVCRIKKAFYEVQCFFFFFFFFLPVMAFILIIYIYIFFNFIVAVDNNLFAVILTYFLIL